MAAHEVDDMAPADNQQQPIQIPDQGESQDRHRPRSSWAQILLISFICFCLPGVSLQR